MSALTSVEELSVSGLLSLYLPVLVVAWLATVVAVPIARMVAIQTGVVDHPDEARKQHRKPVAYLGGVAVFIGLLAGIAVANVVPVPLSFRAIPITIIVGMVAIMVTGAGDDVWGWDPRLKIVGQLVAATGLAMSGIGTQTAGAFLGYFFGTSQLGFEMPLVVGLVPIAVVAILWWYGFQEVAEFIRNWRWMILLLVAVIAFLLIFNVISGFQAMFWKSADVDVTEWFGIGIVAVLVLGGCNATNLIDGLDGLLTGTAAIMGGGLLIVSVLMALHLTQGDLDRLAEELNPAVVMIDGITLAGARIALCMALIGAMLGFLAYNFNPAVIFLGDAGSLLIGYVCVTIILTLGELGHTHFVLAGLIVFGLPIADTILAIFRRKVQGLSATSPDAGHLHHILKRATGTVKQAVFSMWAIETLFAMIGVAIVATSIAGEARVMVTYLVFIALFGGFAVAGVIMGRRALSERSS
ncbi:MAG: undecaprenyl/decaprenyl-phosphate alpha-N-acetylglucosaminyl 1-phosphate transferase [Phycisphaerales bacterium]|nr:undecaprenyl/decaprenyl-phosphate alpha-N-acetylglucosaminyl 1-phosphate transferase [Phycisphaerales bacterium]